MRFRGKGNEAVLNRAYGGFFFLGAVTLPLGLGLLLDALHLLNFDEGSGGVGPRLEGWAMAFLMLLGLPTVVGMIVATWNGIRQTVRFRHPGLVVLTIISVVCGGGLMVVVPFAPGWNGDKDPVFLDYGLSIAFGIYILGNIAIPAWWFGWGREPYKEPALAV